MRTGLGCINAPLYASEVASCFFATNMHKIHFIRPKTKFLGGFARFRCRVVQVVRSGFGVHKMHHFVLPKLRLVFATNLTNPLLGPKLSFWVVSRDSGAGRYPL